ncbi:uncharacterized protein IL334_002911 [Kwoniella shivajii]|uniref:Nucleic acid-binding protein n=1 Tax=Kwoniella shivajii TaxID=564305 RepID=A0ABZ1CXR9_9TREE|nr:hypothetical protein IL334_002911 [Kwoniella shivajii]
MLSHLARARSAVPSRITSRGFNSSGRSLDVSKVILVGRLGSDPILRTTTSGKPYYTYTVATSVGSPVEVEGGKLQDPPTSWHTIFSFNEFQHPSLQKLGKGSSVYVEAELQMRPSESSSNGHYTHDRAFLKHQKISVINRVKPEGEQSDIEEDITE